MCNCGKKRSALQSQSNTRQQNQPFRQNHYQPPIEPVQKQHTVLFQYTGNTALTIVGNITRKNYRFNFPGDTQPVASGDAAAMMAVPVLKKV